MKFRNLFILVVLILNGCASHRSEFQQRAMVGMTRAQWLSCMGRPLRQARSDDGEVLTYAGTMPRCPLKALFLGPPPRCEVNVTLDQDTVRQIEYRNPDGGAPVREDQCAFLVEDCVE